MKYLIFAENLYIMPLCLKVIAHALFIGHAALYLLQLFSILAIVSLRTKRTKQREKPN